MQAEGLDALWQKAFRAAAVNDLAVIMSLINDGADLLNTRVPEGAQNPYNADYYGSPRVWRSPSTFQVALLYGNGQIAEALMLSGAANVLELMWNAPRIRGERPCTYDVYSSFRWVLLGDFTNDFYQKVMAVAPDDALEKDFDPIMDISRNASSMRHYKRLLWILSTKTAQYHSKSITVKHILAAAGNFITDATHRPEHNTARREVLEAIVEHCGGVQTDVFLAALQEAKGMDTSALVQLRSLEKKAAPKWRYRKGYKQTGNIGFRTMAPIMEYDGGATLWKQMEDEWVNGIDGLSLYERNFDNPPAGILPVPKPQKTPRLPKKPKLPKPPREPKPPKEPKTPKEPKNPRKPRKPQGAGQENGALPLTGVGLVGHPDQIDNQELAADMAMSRTLPEANTKSKPIGVTTASQSSKDPIMPTVSAPSGTLNSLNKPITFIQPVNTVAAPTLIKSKSPTKLPTTVFPSTIKSIVRPAATNKANPLLQGKPFLAESTTTTASKATLGATTPKSGIQPIVLKPTFIGAPATLTRRSAASNPIHARDGVTKARNVSRKVVSMMDGFSDDETFSDDEKPARIAKAEQPVVPPIGKATSDPIAMVTIKASAKPIANPITTSTATDSTKPVARSIVKVVKNILPVSNKNGARRETFSEEKLTMLNPAVKIARNPVAKPVAKPTSQPVVKPIEKPIVKLGAKPNAHPVIKSIAKPMAKVVNNALSNSNNIVVNKSFTDIGMKGGKVGKLTKKIIPVSADQEVFSDEEGFSD